jgi:hypothetical protein
MTGASPSKGQCHETGFKTEIANLPLEGILRSSFPNRIYFHPASGLILEEEGDNSH